MKSKELLSSVLLLAGTFALNNAPVWGAEGIISKVAADAGSNYCHLKFTAIREETLYWDRPILKDPSEGDIIDFYGPCDYDPLGKAEILRQRDEWQRNLRRDSMNGD